MSETLAEYLDRALKQRNMKAAEVASRSGLSASYISRLLKGEKTNLTIETISILVEALDLDALEFFTVAYGKPIAIKPGINATLLADTIQKLIAKPQLIEMVQDVARLSPEDENVIFETIQDLWLKSQRAKRKKR